MKTICRCVGGKEVPDAPCGEVLCKREPAPPDRLPIQWIDDGLTARPQRRGGIPTPLGAGDHKGRAEGNYRIPPASTEVGE